MEKEEREQKKRAYAKEFLERAKHRLPAYFLHDHYRGVRIRDNIAVRELMDELNQKHGVLVEVSPWKITQGATPGHKVTYSTDAMYFKDDEQKERFHLCPGQYSYGHSGDHIITEELIPTREEFVKSRSKKSKERVEKRYTSNEGNPSFKSLCNRLAQNKSKWGSLYIKHSHDTRILRQYEDYPVTAYVLQGRQMVCIMKTARLTLGLEVVAGVDNVESMRVPLADAIMKIKKWQEQPVYGTYDEEELKELEVGAIAEAL